MDNFYKNCPAKMSDGRIFSDYRSSTRKNEYMKFINGITRDDDYRIFLQNNGQQIVNSEFNFYKKSQTCQSFQCVHDYPTRVYSPWFIDERKNYDSAMLCTDKKFPCKTYKDYRLTKKDN
jgi:hypothetical protein